MNSPPSLTLFQNPAAFWCGTVAISIGVVFHYPMYLHSAEMNYQMAGMPIDATMIVGMALLVIGMILTLVGLVPWHQHLDASQFQNLRVAAMDDAPLTRAHVTLLLVMAIAVTIDVMKPTTLAFVMPGIAQEYDLQSPLNPGGTVPVAWLPFVALSGMIIGAVVWGALGDKIGRRASILLAGVMFIGTSVCGAMPSFGLNLVMCFLMGVAVGGMLPIAFALLAETIPARHRGSLMVLIGGDVAGAYILTSFLASLLEPQFGWRIMWLIGLPSGILLIALNRWIPESPRFLLSNGMSEEAGQIMARFGARVVIEEMDKSGPIRTYERGRYTDLVRPPFRGLTVGIALFGIGWGLVNNGFLLWLPTNLRQLGHGIASTDQLLASSALIGLPCIFAVAWLYGMWSSKYTMIICALSTTAVLTTFAMLGETVADRPALLRVLIVVLLASTGAMLAVLTPYSSEIFPTRIRSRGTGLAGMCARIGGLLGASAVLAHVAPPSLEGAAILGATPTALAAIAIWRVGIETRRRKLEEITPIDPMLDL